MQTQDVRPSPIAGTWYEGNPKKLTEQVDKLLEQGAPPFLGGDVIAVIVPHAGHRYSGAVAAHAFAALSGQAPDIVAVISPFHNYAAHPLLTTAHKAYATPLGSIEVDEDALNQLQANLNIPIAAIKNDREHSLEIELPFLQRVFQNGFKLLPIMVRDQEEIVAKKLGEALAKTLTGKNAILTASTDLSHFYDQETANKFDREMLHRFELFDPSSIFQAEHSGKGFACGHAAVAAVLWASKALGADKVQILNYATSGDVTGDYSSVVGYGAGVVLKTKKLDRS